MSCQRLPFEIVSRILLLGMPDLNVDTHMEVRRHQVLVGSICSGWRQVCHQTQLLWTSLSFVYEQPTDGPYRLVGNDILEEVIVRSGSRELDVVVFDHRYGRQTNASDPMLYAYSRAHALLVSVLPRTRTLCVSGTRMRVMSPVCTSMFPIQDARCLRELRLDHLSPQGSPLLLFASEEVAPRLEMVESFGSPRMRLPPGCVEQLRVYAGDGYNGLGKAANVKNLVRLETLTLWGGESEQPTEWPSSLRILDVGTDGIGSTPGVFALSTNIVHVTFRMAYWPFSDAPDSSWPEMPALRSLSVSMVGKWATYISDVFKRAPNLVALEANAQLAMQLIPLFDLPGTNDGGEPTHQSIVPNVTLLRIFDYPVQNGGATGRLRATEGHMRFWTSALCAPRAPALRIHWYDADPAALHFKRALGASGKVLPPWVSIKHYQPPIMEGSTQHSHPLPMLSTMGELYEPGTPLVSASRFLCV